MPNVGSTELTPGLGLLSANCSSWAETPRPPPQLSSPTQGLTPHCTSPSGPRTVPGMGKVIESPPAQVQGQKRCCSEEHLLGPSSVREQRAPTAPLPLGYKDFTAAQTKPHLISHITLLSTLPTLHILLFTLCIVK